MKKLKMQKSVYALSVVTILCIGGTAAYFSDVDQAENRVAVGRNTTEIQEEFPDPSDPGEKEKPEYRKTVWVGNCSSSESGFNVDCYVRVNVSYSNYDIGRAVTLLGLDNVNWVFNSNDGYYYFRKKLKEGEASTPLFTGFQIDKSKVEMLYLDTIDDFQINIYEESVAASEFKDYQSAWNFYGNPIGNT